MKPVLALQPKPPIACAWGACPNMVTRGEEYSFILTLATRGAEARAGSFQCPDVDELLSGNLDAQHFCCSIECAALCAHACIDEHLVPRHQDHLATLAQTDADLAAEQAAFAAYQAEKAQQGSTPIASETPSESPPSEPQGQIDMPPPDEETDTPDPESVPTLQDSEPPAPPDDSEPASATSEEQMFAIAPSEVAPEPVTEPAVDVPLATEPIAETPAADESPAPEVDTPTLTMPIITDASTPEPEQPPDASPDLAPQESDHDDTPTEPAREPTLATESTPSNEEFPQSSDDASGTETGTPAGDPVDHVAG